MTTNNISPENIEASNDLRNDKNDIFKYLINYFDLTKDTLDIKIPYNLNHKELLIKKGYYLEQLRDSLADAELTAETFEIKRIPNNLDVYVDDSYKTINTTDVIHSGIEFFIYDISQSILNELNDISLLNALYCLYFEVNENDKVRTFLIDYLSAINLLSASGNEYYKDLIIGAVAELKEADEIIDKYNAELSAMDNELIKKYSENNELYVNEMDKAIDELQSEYIVLIQDKLTEIGNKYNSGNVILLGSDIFSRIAIPERNIDPDYFDKIISEKVDKIIADKIRTNKGLK